MTAKSTKDIDAVWKQASHIKDNTPLSFYQLEAVKLLFRTPFDKEHSKTVLEMFETYPCLPILPEELFFYSYPESVMCPNPVCGNSLIQQMQR